MKITIKHWDGEQVTDVQVDALGCGVPGLAIHAPHLASGWVITHVASGLTAGWFPDADPETVLACTLELGRLCDWTGRVPVTGDVVRPLLARYGGRSVSDAPDAVRRELASAWTGTAA